MQLQFICCNPHDTLARVLDAARRLGLGIASLNLEQAEKDRYRLRLVLSERDTPRVQSFWERVVQYCDLEPVHATE